MVPEADSFDLATSILKPDPNGTFDLVVGMARNTTSPPKRQSCRSSDRHRTRSRTRRRTRTRATRQLEPRRSAPCLGKPSRSSPPRTPMSFGSSSLGTTDEVTVEGNGNPSEDVDPVACAATFFKPRDDGLGYAHPLRQGALAQPRSSAKVVERCALIAFADTGRSRHRGHDRTSPAAHRQRCHRIPGAFPRVRQEMSDVEPLGRCPGGLAEPEAACRQPARVVIKGVWRP